MIIFIGMEVGIGEPVKAENLEVCEEVKLRVQVPDLVILKLEIFEEGQIVEASRKSFELVGSYI